MIQLELTKNSICKHSTLSFILKTTETFLILIQIFKYTFVLYSAEVQGHLNKPSAETAAHKQSPVTNKAETVETNQKANPDLQQECQLFAKRLLKVFLSFKKQISK